VTSVCRCCSSNLDAINAGGQTVSSKPNSPTYAPAVFSDLPKGAGLKDKFKTAMMQLLANRTIKLVNAGSPSRPRGRLVRADQVSQPLAVQVQQCDQGDTTSTGQG
jgi:hypothetical protein